MGIGVARIDGDRTPVRVDGAVPPVVGLEDDAEIAVPVRLIGHEHEAALDQREGFAVAFLLMREHPGIVQRTRMIGDSLEYWAVDFLSVGALLVLLQKYR